MANLAITLHWKAFTVHMHFASFATTKLKKRGSEKANEARIQCAFRFCGVDFIHRAGKGPNTTTQGKATDVYLRRELGRAPCQWADSGKNQHSDDLARTTATYKGAPEHR